MTLSATFDNSHSPEPGNPKPSFLLSLKGLFSQRPFLPELLACFQSVQLAVVLLSFLAIATLIGVVTPQEGTIDPAEIERQFGVQHGFMKTMGFFNVYSSFWYITLEILFFFNLLIGSFKWLKRATLAATQRLFYSAQLLSIKPLAFSLLAPAPKGLSESLPDVLAVLKQKGYRVHTVTTSDTADSAECQVYAHKGSWTRFGPHMAHIGILLCLIASLLGVFTGFKAQKIAVPGAPAWGLRDVDAFMPNLPNESLWMGHVPNWTVKVNKFWIEYYPVKTQGEQPTPKQYYSDIQLIDADSKVIKEQVISVNHPIEHDFVSIYQASFTPSGMFDVKVNGKNYHVGINDDFNGRPVSLIKLDNGQTLIMLPFFAKQDEGVDTDFAAFVLKPNGDTKEMPPNTRLGVGQKGQVAGNVIEYTGPQYATGLQIKRAPEYHLMYLSYLIISIGAAVSFFSQRQLWLSLKQTDAGETVVTIVPKTNKAWFSFRQEVTAIQRALFQKLLPVKH